MEITPKKEDEMVSNSAPGAILLPPSLDIQGSGLVDRSIDFHSNNVVVPLMDQFENYSMLSLHGYDNYSPPCDPCISSQFHGYNNLTIDSHNTLNENISSFEPIYDGSTTYELPSFQCIHTRQCNLNTLASRLPPHQSVDTLIQIPPIEEPNNSIMVYPDKGGFLNTRSFHNGSNVQEGIEQMTHDEALKDSNVQEGIEQTTHDEAFKISTYTNICAKWDKLDGLRYNLLDESFATFR
uniref:Uncharacterized protein LOC105853111 n=1 Tax=Cicer arietinum TaxID=3827 RepID=A0A1S3EIF8_CICAR|nr:uncharacterized protein LOC105853111 [Cicer arietinum]